MLKYPGLLDRLEGENLLGSGIGTKMDSLENVSDHLKGDSISVKEAVKKDAYGCINYAPVLIRNSLGRKLV